MKPPRTLQEAIIYFSDYDRCREFMTELRWPNGVACPNCGSDHVVYLDKARVWKCYGKHEKAKFSLKTGTIFEDSPLGLDKWLVALWLIVNCKNGISSMEISRDLGITQKSAWFMAHRLRLALHLGSFDKLSGEVEVDETYIGGKARNMSIARRRKTGITKGRSMAGKVAVMGLLERHPDGMSRVEPYHLFRYLDEQAYRFNQRKGLNDYDRFRLALSQVVGKRLTWKQVIGAVEPSASLN